MKYFYYNQPFIYIQKDIYEDIHYMNARFMFAKPDNGNYIIKTDDIVSMYLEINPSDAVSFDDAIEHINKRKQIFNDKLNWHKRSDFLPPKYIVDKILAQERLEKTITERMNKSENEEKINNYKRQIRDIHRSLRRLHKRTYSFETSNIGCDIHLLKNIDFSKERILEAIEKCDKEIERIENYRDSTKKEKPFIL